MANPESGCAGPALATNEQDRTSKKQQTGTLQREVDQLDFDITELGDSVKGLSKDITKLTADREESEKLRQAEKEENEDAMKDAQDREHSQIQAKPSAEGKMEVDVKKEKKKKEYGKEALPNLRAGFGAPPGLEKQTRETMPPAQRRPQQ
ncbi:gacGG [Symbiodinium sp. CCMP2592]|nr:gacGG [Symbiodinium sp. CCMP2592]